jgi:hypothetical protein
MSWATTISVIALKHLPYPEFVRRHRREACAEVVDLVLVVVGLIIAVSLPMGVVAWATGWSLDVVGWPFIAIFFVVFVRFRKRYPYLRTPGKNLFRVDRYLDGGSVLGQYARQEQRRQDLTG